MNANDNCPGVANPDQADGDGDGVGTACDLEYAFSGFFSPVDNPPTRNSVKAGLAIPVKFSLNGFQGLGILASGSPYSQQISWKTEKGWKGTCRRLVLELDDGSQHVALFTFN